MAPGPDLGWCQHPSVVCARLTGQTAGDMAVSGSSDLAVSVLQMGLPDEARIMVNPVVLGGAKSVSRTPTTTNEISIMHAL
jgi:dihydrofolate reductase